MLEETITVPPCFIDDQPSVGLVAGAWVCVAHSQCARCGADLRENLAPVGCVCHDYGYSGHEDDLWCSLDCLELSHPEPDVDLHEEGRDAGI